MDSSLMMQKNSLKFSLKNSLDVFFLYISTVWYSVNKDYYY